MFDVYTMLYCDCLNSYSSEERTCVAKCQWMRKAVGGLGELGNIHCPRKFLKCNCDGIESGSNLREMTEIWML